MLIASVALAPGGAAAGIVNWENIGPTGVGITAIAVAPSCPDTILVSTTADSVYLMRTSDGGTTWQAVNDITCSPTALAFDSQDPMLAYCISCVDVWKSVDAGLHWSPVLQDVSAVSLTVDPYAPRRLFVGTVLPRDLYFSPDAGATWRRIGIDPDAPDFTYVSDVITDPSDTSIVFAGTSLWYTHPDSPVWRTEDFGLSWTPMGPFGEFPAQMTEAEQLGMAHGDPDFVVAGSGGRGFGPFYLTTDGGTNWLPSRIGIDESSANGIEITSLRPWPANPAVLVAAAYEHDGHDSARCLYLSFDHAGTWQPLVCDPDMLSSVRLDIDSSGRVLYSTRFGVKRSIHDGVPDVVVHGKVVDDSVGGNGNGIPEAGETSELVLTIQNRGDRAEAVNGTITCDDVFVDILVGTSSFGSLEFGGRGESDPPYEIRLSPEREPGPIRLTLHALSGGHDFDRSLYLGARVAVLDDDNNCSYDEELLEALDANLIGYDVIPTVAYQPITYEAISGYAAVIWTTGDSRESTITEAEEEVLMQYLDAGGALYLNSQNYLHDGGGALTDFGSQYLHLAGYFNGTAPSGVLGVDGDPVSDGMYAGPLDYPFTNRSDTVFADSLAAVIFTNAPGGIMGNSVRYPKEVGAEAYRLVFTSFPFEAFPAEGEDPNNQRTLIKRIMEWLVPDGGLVPTGVPSASGEDAPRHDLHVASFPNPQTRGAELVLTSGPHGCSPEIAVYAVDGRLIRELACPTFQGDGAVSVTWDGRDSGGKRVASGVYFVKVRAGEEEATTRITLLR
jgi:photosystem II stability/assembly factor-like uncharacterized protein